MIEHFSELASSNWERFKIAKRQLRDEQMQRIQLQEHYDHLYEVFAKRCKDDDEAQRILRGEMSRILTIYDKLLTDYDLLKHRYDKLEKELAETKAELAESVARQAVMDGHGGPWL